MPPPTSLHFSSFLCCNPDSPSAHPYYRLFLEKVEVGCRLQLVTPRQQPSFLSLHPFAPKCYCYSEALLGLCQKLYFSGVLLTLRGLLWELGDRTSTLRLKSLFLVDYSLWSNDEAWSHVQNQLLLTVGVWSLLCGENQPLLRPFVDVANSR